MILDYHWPDDIDPSEVEGIAEACESAALERARLGGYFTADELFSAARLLRLLHEAHESRWSGVHCTDCGTSLEAGGHEREEAPGIVSLVCVVCRALTQEDRNGE